MKPIILGRSGLAVSPLCLGAMTLGDHGDKNAVLRELFDRDQAVRTALFRARLAEQSVDFAGALTELVSTLHRVALGQMLPGAVDNALGDADRVVIHANRADLLISFDNLTQTFTIVKPADGTSPELTQIVKNVEFFTFY